MKNTQIKSNKTTTKMKKSMLALGAVASMMLTAVNVNAQDAVVVEEESVVMTEEIPCKTHYYTDSHDNWFIQLGAGINAPLFDRCHDTRDPKTHFTAAYNVGFGRWFSPYLGWRLGFTGGALHWDFHQFSKAKYVNANLDIMWDMFNSHKVNSKRVFSIIPFVGIGGTYAWDYKVPTSNVKGRDAKPKSNNWMLPVSAGLQLRFRLCEYVDFFAEGRAGFYGDNFDHFSKGHSIDVLITAMGGLSFNIGGRDYRSYNPCDYLGYINSLNGQVNDLRGELAATAAALAAAESQLPCPEAPEVVPANETPLMATVRFKINSAVISSYEEVNVYNIAQWMKANPSQKVTICGYADKDTGTADYNMALSKRRAEAVRNALVNDYGISADRLNIQAEGSAVQPYPANNDWNRIVIFGSK